MGKKNIAIVTGASGGFGKEFIKLLVKERAIDEIWAVARNERKLSALAEEFGSKLQIFSMDLSDREELKRFASILDNADVAVAYLINNAGYGKFCSYEELDIEESLNMIDVNVSAVVGLGLICIPHMQSGGHILNIASQAAFQPLPYLNIYSATKAFVRNYSRALNVELKEKRISVTAVCPGWMKTDFFQRADIGAKKGITRFRAMRTPEEIAKRALQDAKKGKAVSMCGAYVRVEHIVSKLMPQRIMMWFWVRQQRLR